MNEQRFQVRGSDGDQLPDKRLLPGLLESPLSWLPSIRLTNILEGGGLRLHLRVNMGSNLSTWLRGERCAGEREAQAPPFASA